MAPWLVVIVIAALVALAAAIAVNLRLRPVRRSELKIDRTLATPSAPARKAPASPSTSAEAPDAPADVDVYDRLRVLGAAVAAFFGVLLFRLGSMQLFANSSYSDRAERNRTSEVSIRAVRGRILDRNGNVLVDNRASMALVADKSVADDTRLVRRLANLLGMPEVAVRRAVQSTAEGAQSLRTVMIDVPESAVAYVAEHPAQFPGVQVEARSIRSYPYGSLACHLLGYTGTVTQDELDAFAADEDNLISYQSGDTVGKAGVEYQYESVLQGVRGVRTVHVNASGDVTGVVSEVPAEPGSDVRLSIDVNVQLAAERGIQAGMEAGRYQGYSPTGGACVCLNCKTGEILALASYPDYNPTSFIGGISSDDWAQLVSAEANSPLLNRVIDGQYPSASTIKPLTTCAALENGVAGYDSTYYCTGWWTGLGDAYGKWCWNHSGHGTLSLREGIVYSCDTVFYEIAKSFYYSGNPYGIQEMYRRWGLGSKTGVDLPGEYAGRVPDGDWKWSWYTWSADSDRQWQPGDTANIAIGQGDLLVTPMQMAYVYCGLACGGREMWPHLMLDVRSSETGDALACCNERVGNTVSVDAAYLSFVRDAMHGVVYENFTSAYFEGLPVEVMGKSGTGEAGDDEDNTHAWFVAAAPYDDPTYVVCALVEHGGGGSTVASHVCREVLGAIYGVEDTDPVELLRQTSASTTASGRTD